MSATHPPIPPNCPYFREYPEFGIVFVWPDSGVPDDSASGFADQALPLDKLKRTDKPIIAAVAEVAWREESERLDRDWSTKYEGTPRSSDIVEANGLLIEIGKVEAIARAWRAWGKGEWKPA